MSTTQGTPTQDRCENKEPCPPVFPSSSEPSLPAGTVVGLQNFFAEVPLQEADKKAVAAIHKMISSYDEFFEFLRNVCRENRVEHDSDSLHCLSEQMKQQLSSLAEVVLEEPHRLNCETLKIKPFIEDFRHVMLLCSSCRTHMALVFCQCGQSKLCEGCLVKQEASCLCNCCQTHLTYEHVADLSIRKRVRQQILHTSNQATCCKCEQDFTRGSGTYFCETCEEYTCPVCFKEDVLEMMPRDRTESIKYTCRSCWQLSAPIPIVDWNEECMCSAGTHNITDFLPAKCQGIYHCREIWRTSLEFDHCPIHHTELTPDQVSRVIGWFLIKCAACRLIAYAPKDKACFICRECSCKSCWELAKTGDMWHCPVCSERRDNPDQ